MIDIDAELRRDRSGSALVRITLTWQAVVKPGTACEQTEQTTIRPEQRRILAPFLQLRCSCDIRLRGLAARDQFHHGLLASAALPWNDLTSAGSSRGSFTKVSSPRSGTPSRCRPKP